MMEPLLSRFVGCLSPIGDRRRMEPRESILVSAELKHGAGEWSRIEVANISAHGLMGSADFELTPGHQVMVRIADNCLRADVRWARHGRFGLHFDVELDLDPLLIELSRPVNAAQSAQMSRWMI